jgi:hypothetical protein
MPIPSATAVPTAGEGRLYAPFAAFLVVYVLLGILNTWPLAQRIGSHLPHDLGDAVVSLTLLQWNTEVPLFTACWWNGVGFYPLEDTLTFSDARLGLTLAGWPVKWATGSAVAMHNTLFILSFALSGLAMHGLVFTLTRSHSASFVAGCAYAFAPVRAAHLSAGCVRDICCRDVPCQAHPSALHRSGPAGRLGFGRCARAWPVRAVPVAPDR